MIKAYNLPEDKNIGPFSSAGYKQYIRYRRNLWSFMFMLVVLAMFMNLFFELKNKFFIIENLLHFLVCFWFILDGVLSILFKIVQVSFLQLISSWLNSGKSTYIIITGVPAIIVATFQILLAIQYLVIVMLLS